MAQTGSGKTLALLLPLLESVTRAVEQRPSAACTALLLAPSDVLVEQHAATARTLLAGLDPPVELDCDTGASLTGVGGLLEDASRVPSLLVATAAGACRRLEASGGAGREWAARLAAVAIDEAHERWAEMGQKPMPFTPRDRRRTLATGGRRPVRTAARHCPAAGRRRPPRRSPRRHTAPPRHGLPHLGARGRAHAPLPPRRARQRALHRRPARGDGPHLAPALPLPGARRPSLLLPLPAHPAPLTDCGRREPQARVARWPSFCLGLLLAATPPRLCDATVPRL